MWPRKLIDISWSDLAFGASRCIAPGKTPRYPECQWVGHDHSVACLSVRSGFDLLLQVLRIPIGSEVLMSAVTIPDMVQIVRHHGLVPVPVDVDSTTLGPSMDSLNTRITAPTRLVVIAHLFGSRVPLEPIIETARRHKLIVIEDCAQAFCGREYLGHPDADASCFSFGPIKTASALGGALIRVRDRRILEEIRRLQGQYPPQSQRRFAFRLLKYAFLKLASQRLLFGAFLGCCRVVGRDPDRLVNSLARNFKKGDLIGRIRHRPCAALLALLARRWQSYGLQRLERRAALGSSLASRLKEVVCVPGFQSPHHTHWVFPVATKDPDQLARSLRAAGFDATRSHHLAALEHPADISHPEATSLVQMLPNVVFLPMYPELTEVAVAKMANIILQHEIDS